MLPCGHPPKCPSDTAQTLSPSVSSTPTLSRSCQIPLTAMDFLLAPPKTRFPVVLDQNSRSHSVPTASSASKLYSSCESVHTDSSCPETEVDPLLGFCLSRAFSFHASDPHTLPNLEGLEMLLHSKARSTTQRTLRPFAPGETFPTQMHRAHLVGSF
jgi:hypothetical protein